MVALFLVVNQWDNHTVDGNEEFWLVPYQTRQHNHSSSLEVELWIPL